MAGPVHPYPDLQVQPNSGLTFPWAFETGPTGNVSDASFGPEGVAAVEFMFIYDADTNRALPQILGFSSRNTNPDPDPPILQRTLPMRHPFYNQMFATRIVKVDGIGPTEKYDSDTGPYQRYHINRLTIQFSRPPYALLEDDEIDDDATGVPQEWLRYTTYQWTPAVEILARQGTTFIYSTPTTAPYVANAKFNTSLGLPIAKMKLTLTWHQIPQLALYDANFFPINTIYDFDSGDLLLGAVNNAVFFGCAIGTLLYLGPEIIPRPLQLPPDLMNLDIDETFFLQYDIKFHFVYFDPPTGANETVRGWNTAPWADTFWYAVQSKVSAQPPFTSGQMQSLFQIA